jgi:DNA-directed RNA polymerase specialized sigma24 family protein
LDELEAAFRYISASRIAADAGGVSMKRDWAATPDDLSRLVEWLDPAGPGGESYVAMHRRLESYFARKGCRAAAEMADDTLTRVARRLHEEGAITDVPPAQYCYITARFVFLEYLRNPEHDAVPLVRDLPDRPARVDEDDEDGSLLTRLDECLAQLEPRDRTLILEYYSGSPADRIARRRDLAARLGLSLNATAIRACRLRERLRACLGRAAAPP